jgi:PAS domain S-box-containing protein
MPKEIIGNLLIEDDQSVEEIVDPLLDRVAALVRQAAIREPDRPIDRDFIVSELCRAKADRVLVRFEVEYPTPDTWLEVLAYPARDGLMISVWDLSDRKRAMSALAESEASYRDLFEDAPIGYQELDLEGRFTRVNRTQLAMLGYTADEVLGRHIWDFEWAHGEDPAETRRKFLDKMSSGRLPPTFERVRVRKDGTLVPVLVEDRFIRDTSGRITGLRTTMLDITLRKQSEATQAWLAAIVESSVDAIIGKTPDGVITSWNPAAERLYGYDAREMIGRSVALLVPPNRPDELPGLVDRLARGEHADHYETIHVRKDRRRIRVSVATSAVRDATGELVGVSTITRDVTRRKWTDELLAGERHVLEMIARGLPLAAVLEVLARTVEGLADDGLLVSILLLDDDGIHLHHGAAPSLPDEYTRALDGVQIGPKVGSCGTAAYRGESVIVTDIATDPLWADLADLADLALAHGLRACWSTPIRGSDGQVLGTFALYYREPRAPSDEHRRLATLVGRTAALIIERKRADETGARLAAIVESSDDAIIGKTPDGVITSWNPAAERLYGYDAREMIGRSMTRIIPPDRLDEYHGVMRRMRRGERMAAFDTVRIHRDGHPVDVSLSLAPITDASGAVFGISAIARDISERRALERLQQAFLAMVTHELRNPITGIKGFGQLLKRRGEHNERAVEAILHQVGLLERLVNDLLDASRVQVGQLQLQRGRVDLVAEVQACAEQAQQQTAAHEIRVDAPNRPLEGWWDRARLEQIFSNLLTNAIKYSPDGGEVLVAVRDLGAEAQVSVRDQGRGIAPDKLPHLFERFFRADDFEAARSLGLGLYITRGIVASHAGRIWAESDGVGKGSTFSFTLPYAEPAAERDGGVGRSQGTTCLPHDGAGR